MNLDQTIRMVTDLVYLLCFAAGIYFAVPVEEWIAEEFVDWSDLEQRGVRLLRILAATGLALLLASPLIDLVSVLQALVSTGLAVAAGQAGSLARTSWGVGPGLSFTATTLVVLAITYGLVIRLVRSIPISESARAALDRLPDSSRTMLALAAASAAWRAVNFLISRVLNLQIPVLQASAAERGLIGYIGGWLLALLLVVTVGLYLDARMVEFEAGEMVQTKGDAQG